MKVLAQYTKEELAALKAETQKRYDAFAAKGLAIDMSRGKPGSDQLDISNFVLDNLDTYKAENGFDCRNYGLLPGIDECRRLFADILGMDMKNVIACGSSSLNLMFDYIAQCYTHGAGGAPWGRLDKVKFIAVVPGYDRHFAIGSYFGFEYINVPILADGPDMDRIEELIKDEAVKGMFCVPKYSNPDGITYSDAVVERLAKMKPAAKDFRVIWDNAYCVHDLTDDGDELKNIFDEAKKYGNEDIFVIFTSTSKITFPGAGVSCVAASDNNVAAIMKRLTLQTISYDKVNQLRHARAFKDIAGIKEHMKLHAAILRPKFRCVLDILEKELGGLGVASWAKPNGGYFISLNVDGGSAKKAGELCRQAGLVLTGVGATFPGGIDPDDRNIRIAPTFPPVAELALAAELLCIAVKLVCLENAGA
ncbi:MAG: aminotransferase class I/II-fold pyridoxal phosphate-dependent enzyme [Oscillospiraceae bacterium]|jgi:aspartate/methionine/tyrosine aminotransferase|nr:aminotransferase class I/II-fold pyridoxal phosphate-dependent enzyme [Oscillospiraceae bacterium]